MNRIRKHSWVLAPDDDELQRVNNVLNRVGGPNVQWGAVNRLEVWLIETRLEAERVATRRILIATWVLAVATVALVVATVGLLVVTLQA